MLPPPPAVVDGQAAAAPATDSYAQAAGLDSAPRVQIDTVELAGSITLFGGRLDDLKLKSYRETLDEDSELVTLLAPIGQEQSYYALYGWARAGSLAADDVPSATTLWQLESGETLSVDAPITLRWDNSKGLIFRRTFAVDQHYMFTVTQSVENNSDTAYRAQPYGIIARHDEPDTVGFFILHEGVVRMSDGELEEIDYDDMPDLDVVQTEGANADLITVETEGWVGFTDKNWMTTLIPAAGFTSVVKYDPRRNIYQTEARMPTQDIAPGATVSVQSRLFAGAKEWETIRAYEK